MKELHHVELQSTQNGNATVRAMPHISIFIPLFSDSDFTEAALMESTGKGLGSKDIEMIAAQWSDEIRSFSVKGVRNFGHVAHGVEKKKLRNG